jgi:hypothetical protein
VCLFFKIYFGQSKVLFWEVSGLKRTSGTSPFSYSVLLH